MLNTKIINTLNKNEIKIEPVSLDNPASIRLIHVPTGIVVEYDKESSVYENYRRCLKILKREINIIGG